MNWADCAKTIEATFGYSRFKIPSNGLAGFNCEDGVTISDFTGGLGWLWAYGGDAVLRLPPVNKFLELEANHIGGYLSGFVTMGIIIAVCIVWGLFETLFELCFRR